MIPNTLEGELLRRKLRKDYSAYVQYVNEGFYLSHFHKYLCDKIQEFVTMPPTGKALDILLLSVPPRHGKQESLKQDILTTDGWKKFGDLVIGDKVYSPEGKPVAVLNIIPQTEPCSLVVTTSNGARTVVHPNHEWRVQNRLKHGHPYENIETHTLLELGLDNNKTGRGHR